MRKIAIVTMVAVVLGGLSLGASVAGAWARRDNPDFCQALADIPNNATSDASGITEDGAKAYAKGLRRASVFAPRKVKKAMRKLARFYARMGRGENPVDVIAQAGVAFGKVSGIYSTYYLEQCAGVSLPDTNPRVQLEK